MSAVPSRDSLGPDHDRPIVNQLPVEPVRSEAAIPARNPRQWATRSNYRYAAPMPAPGQTIVIWGDRDRLPETKQRLVPRPLAVLAKFAALGAVMAGIYWGPPYLTCRELKERGMFYYGTSVSSCMQERIAARTNPFEAITKYVLPVL